MGTCGSSLVEMEAGAGGVVCLLGKKEKTSDENRK